MLRAGLVQSCNALCSEIEAPGWLPPVVGFLGIAGVLSLRRRWRQPVVIFFTATFVLVAAKIWGVPGVQVIGMVPILHEINWPRYGAFLLFIAAAVVGVHGVRHLLMEPAREWRVVVGGWLACVTVMAAIAWSHIAESGALSDAARERAVYFLMLDIAWAMLPPLLMWIARLRADAEFRVPFIAGFGMVLPAIAYGTGGFTATQYVLLSALYLGAFVLASAIAVLVPRLNAWTGAALLVLCGAVPVNATAAMLRSGLPPRYDALALPPYLVKLGTLQEGGLYRSFSFDAVPMPNVQTAVGIPGMGWIVPLVPEPSRLFFKQFLDRTIRMPNWYAGNVTAWPDAVPHGALKELQRNLSFFSLSAVRYVVTQHTSLDAASTGLKKELKAIYHDSTSGVTIFENIRALPRVFLASRIRTVERQEQAWQALREVESLRDEVIVETDTPMASMRPKDGGTGTVLNFEVSANEVRTRFHATMPGMLVLTDLMVPGWHVEVNGAAAPLYRVNGVFRGVPLEGAGSYDIRFWYRPRYWTASLLLAIAGGFAAGLACLACWRGGNRCSRQRKAHSEKAGA